ncbi:aldo/keto reductase [Pseudooceanicola sp. 216_PA32_1]|uniref:Aldo/keto reductase n=1 Tax=Pseudooceanicola pacificus TaxID=2676438 RepID=A0A844W057_9RHOB|nr:aldo/keto reductase [Pseudooceanicola pacificus]MWB77446.1 aldo/keto reductase [Pseudooceanicola pacificus]
MQKRRLGKTGLDISPIVFGGNVFGWTADEPTSFRLLDMSLEAGLNTIDTADVYSRWGNGHTGGESETVIGNWLASHPGHRDKVVIITKVGSDMGGEGKKGLSPRWIEEEVEQSLSRLKTDYIDLYLSHRPDPDTPQEETLTAYARLIESGKVRAIGASNFDRALMEQADAAAASAGVTPYAAQQPEYNLYSRASFEGPLAEYCLANDIGVIPYFSLAAGFLTGKYRTEADLTGPRGERSIAKYMDQKGMTLLAAMDEVAEQTGASLAEIALAWMLRKPAVTAPIASATSESQLATLIRSVELNLSDAQMARLDAAV